MTRVAAVLVFIIAAIAASAQTKLPSKAEPIFSVCDLRSDGGFAKFYDEIVTVSGQVEAKSGQALLLGQECNQTVQLVESESLRKQNSPTLIAFRNGIEAKVGCRDERPLRVIVRGKFEMAHAGGDLLYTLEAASVVRAEFLNGRSLNCSLPTNPILSLDWLFPEPLDVEGRVVAYHWANHVFPGFEGIHIEHFVLRVERVLAGHSDPKYLRVDFWGASHLDEYRLPDEIFEEGKLWRMYLVPHSAASVSKETCQPDVDLTITYVDENGREIGKEPTFSSLDTVSDLPDFGSLPCYVLRKENLSIVP